MEEDKDGFQEVEGGLHVGQGIRHLRVAGGIAGQDSLISGLEEVQRGAYSRREETAQEAEHRRREVPREEHSHQGEEQEAWHSRREVHREKCSHQAFVVQTGIQKEHQAAPQREARIREGEVLEAGHSLSEAGLAEMGNWRTKG